MPDLEWTKYISDIERMQLGPCLDLLAHYGYSNVDPLDNECYEMGSNCPIRDKCGMLAEIVLGCRGCIEPDDGKRESPVVAGRVWHKGSWV